MPFTPDDQTSYPPPPHRPPFTRYAAQHIATLLFSQRLQTLALQTDVDDFLLHDLQDPMEEGRMHYSITRSANSQAFEVTDILALTTTPEEKTLKRLAQSIGESYC